MSGSGRSHRFPGGFQVIEKYEIEVAVALNFEGPVVEAVAARIDFSSFGQLGDETEAGPITFIRGEDLDGGDVPRERIATPGRGILSIR